MTLPRTLFESPSGLIHVVEMFPPSVFRQNKPKARTLCGREVDVLKWMRISLYDEKMFSMGPRAIRRMVENPTCEKCLPRY
jgi:hypothetical protein